MAHPDETRKAVRAAFVFDAQTLEIVALRYQVPLATVRRWKSEARAAGDDWDKARGAQMIAGGGIEEVVRQTLGLIVQQVQATMEQIQAADVKDIGPAEKVKMLASLADSYNKLMACSKRLMPETDKLAVAMDVLRRLVDWVKENAPQHVATLAQIVGPFGESLAGEYGHK